MDSSLQFAKIISDRVNTAWEDGSFLNSVTPTTRELLTYWFNDAYVDMRDLNFHIGQRQAILNVIYIHEVLKKESVLDAYDEIAPQLLAVKNSNLSKLSDAIYDFPKYCIKMATGTGKTWVAEALIIWQYLNAKHEEEGNYTKNFLVVAPGIIVYERWLDAFCGKVSENGLIRDFETCDLKKNEELFIPELYRDEVYGFIQSSVKAKNEICSPSGEGLIAITNYHLLMGVDDIKKQNDDTWSLPVTPGTTAGHSLDDLDASLNGKKELEYLHNLANLMVINDEAHHIHDNNKSGESDEVQWQKSLRYIAETKGRRNIQLDFSATPYTQFGKKKQYFPHIVTNFEIEEAITSGLVKMLLLDERKELNTEELDYKAIRNERGQVTDLSDGQRTMLRAGLAKLNLLEEKFGQVDEDKIPKMLIVCEDTEVVPFVRQFYIDEGLDSDDIIEIHSNKKGEVSEEEWKDIKNQLFSMDRHRKPRVVISVLMLREGFDVNNICVIVPLRSSTSGILLEQIIGRGLRLMWRGNSEIEELKRENRHRIMVERKEVTNYFDILSIVEHPAFREFYQELLNKGCIGLEQNDSVTAPKVEGDLEIVGLKEGYEEYDFRLPLIINEDEEKMRSPQINIDELAAFQISLESLLKVIPEKESWISTEVTKNTYVGGFEVDNNLFKATSYNEYLGKIVNRIVEKLNFNPTKSGRLRGSGTRIMPAMSINNAQIARAIDMYIKKRLFRQDVSGRIKEIWRVLQLKDVTDHIVGQIAHCIIKAQEEAAEGGKIEVSFNALSSIDKIKVRKSYMIEPVKSIYPKLPYPSNKGDYERRFMEFADGDGVVDAFCKIIEQSHTFARFRYVRDDGLPAEYIPDFFVRFGNDIFIVETKAQNMISDANVQRKKKAILRWLEKTNNLSPEKREGYVWHYAIVGEGTFNDWKNKRMRLREILEYCELRNVSIVDRLF